MRVGGSAKYAAVALAAVFLACQAISAYAEDAAPGPVERLVSESLSAKPKVRLDLPDERVRELIGRFRLSGEGRLEDKLFSFLERHREAFGLTEPRAELIPSETGDTGVDRRVVFQQVHGGLPVWGHTLEMEVSGGELVLAVSRIAPVIEVKTEPGITRLDAYNAVKSEWSRQRGTQMPPAGFETVIYMDRLVYDVKLAEGEDVWHILVDASDGKVLHAEKAAKKAAGGCH